MFIGWGEAGVLILSRHDASGFVVMEVLHALDLAV